MKQRKQKYSITPNNIKNILISKANSKTKAVDKNRKKSNTASHNAIIKQSLNPK